MLSALQIRAREEAHVAAARKRMVARLAAAATEVVLYNDESPVDNGHLFQHVVVVADGYCCNESIFDISLLQQSRSTKTCCYFFGLYFCDEASFRGAIGKISTLQGTDIQFRDVLLYVLAVLESIDRYLYGKRATPCLLFSFGYVPDMRIVNLLAEVYACVCIAGLSGFDRCIEAARSYRWSTYECDSGTGTGNGRELNNRFRKISTFLKRRLCFRFLFDDDGSEMCGGAEKKKKFCDSMCRGEAQQPYQRKAWQNDMALPLLNVIFGYYARRSITELANESAVLKVELQEQRQLLQRMM